MSKHLDATKSIVGLAGILCVALAAIAHPTLVGFVLAPDGKVDSPALAQEITSVRILLVVIGLMLLFWRRRLASILVRHPQIVAVSISCAGTVLIIVAVECFMVFADRSHGNATVLKRLNTEEPAVVEDHVLGYKPAPSSRVNARKSFNGRDLYNVIYTHDQYSRRIVPYIEEDLEHAALFFGGSFTYGEGVKDNETMPYYFSKSENVRAFNFGYSGYGPQNMLAILENDRIMRQVSDDLPDEVGCTQAIYTLIDHHVMRSVGAMSVMTYGQNMPYYRISERNKIQRLGSFASGRPLFTPLLRLLSHSRLLRKLSVEIPMRVSEENLRVTAAILDRSRHLLEERFKESNFTVVLYPGTKLASRIKPLLKARQINVLDYSRAGDWVRETMAIPVDLHPNRLGHHMIAGKLAHDIESDSCETRQANSKS